MIKALIKKPEPVKPTPKGFVKVTNRRAGAFILPVEPFRLAPGVSYHDEKHFDDMPDGIVDGLRTHLEEGTLSFEAADTAPPEPAPRPFLPPPNVPDLPSTDAPALSQVPAEALAQIAAETNQATLGAWFEAGQSPDISDAILHRHTELAPS